MSLDSPLHRLQEDLDLSFEDGVKGITSLRSSNAGHVPPIPRCYPLLARVIYGWSPIAVRCLLPETTIAAKDLSLDI